jgi:hypothetical protein
MKKAPINRRPAARAQSAAEELTPQSEPPADRHTHKIVLNVFGKRYELTHRVEVREITKGPAKVTVMPIRGVIEP